MQITVNGEACRFDAATTLAGLLVQMGLADRRVAVERNGEIVPRSQHAATELADGDQLLVVQAIGGG
jgi:sulfur carrier protein